MSDEGQEPTQPAPSEPSSHDLDAAVLRSLLLLSGGNPLEFREYDLPPEEILSWIKRAERRELNGLLIVSLRKWHALRREESAEQQ